MNNVIGYKGTELERRVNWLAMLNFKKTAAFYKNEEKEFYRLSAESSLKRFTTELSDYIKVA